ncbi:hypothetical protein NAT51_19340 [Flavobacterium amniphilum]|uniref:hypothetical protein n=1 Tax=Flavobacterium amniphilum TaxID=1834035 RepID=UPI002029EC83|nr:hypothetical protein [Flavobacterium amniphilum]MCL9807686.1 hypothetical protein [Flavobacterium amniphilum]
MKYYRIQNSIDRKEIGHFLQVQKEDWIGITNTSEDFSEQGLFGKVEGNPALPVPYLYRMTKPTSLLDMTVIPINKYLVVDKAFFEFLKPYLGDFQSWEIKAKKQLEDYEYHIVHIDYPQNDFVNYEKSIFKLFSHDENYNRIDLNQEVKITNDGDSLDKSREYSLKGIGIGYPFLKETKVVFNYSKMTKDLFRCSFVPYAGYYVSENLKNEIEKQGFTGLVFKELDEIDNFVQVEKV